MKIMTSIYLNKETTRSTTNLWGKPFTQVATSAEKKSDGVPTPSRIRLHTARLETLFRLFSLLERSLQQLNLRLCKDWRSYRLRAFISCL